MLGPQRYSTCYRENEPDEARIVCSPSVPGLVFGPIDLLAQTGTYKALLSQADDQSKRTQSLMTSWAGFR